MDDFRFLQDNGLWIIIIAIFLLLFLGGGNGCNSGLNLDCFGGLFNGCGNNSWLWIIIIVFVLCYFMNSGCGSIFRNDIQ